MGAIFCDNQEIKHLYKVDPGAKLTIFKKFDEG